MKTPNKKKKCKCGETVCTCSKSATNTVKPIIMTTKKQKKVRLIDDKGFSLEVKLDEITHYVDYPLAKSRKILRFEYEKHGKIPTYRLI